MKNNITYLHTYTPQAPLKGYPKLSKRCTKHGPSRFSVLNKIRMLLDATIEMMEAEGHSHATLTFALELIDNYIDELQEIRSSNKLSDVLPCDVDLLLECLDHKEVFEEMLDADDIVVDVTPK